MQPRADERWQSWAAMFVGQAAAFADRPAVVDGPVRLTYGELQSIAASIGAGLIRDGLHVGDRMGIWMPNCWQWIAVLLGTLEAGGVPLPFNTRLRGPEAAQLLRAGSARGIFMVDRFLGDDYPSMLRGSGSVPSLELEYEVSLGPDLSQEMRTLCVPPGSDELDEINRRTRSLRHEDPCILVFTSGTTGLPKGVLGTNGRVLRVYSDFGAMLGLEPDDRYLIIPPFSHTYGLCAGLLTSQLYGCCMLPAAVFDVVKTMQLVEHERVTVMPGPPTVFSTILDHPDRSNYNLSTLRAATTGSAMVPVELVRRVKRELGIERFLTAYGLTESTGTVSVCLPSDDEEHVATTSGRPIDGVEVRIVSPQNGQPQKTGDVGEIQVRGYNVMDGYLGTSEQPFTDDGWLKTGDLGRLTNDGYLQIVDRIKDLVIVGGFNVAPTEVENVLLEHPAIAECAVVGIPDPRLGEVTFAFVVLRPGAQVEPDDLMTFCRVRLAGYKVPRGYVFAQTLPRNSLGKVQKDQLRKQADAI